MTVKRNLITDAEFERQIRAAKQRPSTEPAANSAFYKSGEIHIELASGWQFSFPPTRFSEFKNATDSDLTKIGLTGKYTLSCEPLDVDISIGGILFELVGENYLSAAVSRRNGSATSARKKASSRSNGKLGGRPKKRAQSEAV